VIPSRHARERNAECRSTTPAERAPSVRRVRRALTDSAMSGV
jgi:hypothetical protein